MRTLRARRPRRRTSARSRKARTTWDLVTGLLHDGVTVLHASGFIVPLPVLPDAVGTVLAYLPVYPVMELVTMGVGGATMTGEP